MLLYKNTTAPDYPLEKISAPVVLYYSLNDDFTTESVSYSLWQNEVKYKKNIHILLFFLVGCQWGSSKTAKRRNQEGHVSSIHSHWLFVSKSSKEFSLRRCTADTEELFFTMIDEAVLREWRDAKVCRVNKIEFKKLDRWTGDSNHCRIRMLTYLYAWMRI